MAPKANTEPFPWARMVDSHLRKVECNPAGGLSFNKISMMHPLKAEHSQSFGTWKSRLVKDEILIQPSLPETSESFKIGP